MRPVRMLASVTAAAAGITALLAAPADAATPHRPDRAPVFVQTDNPAGNTIVAYDRTASGGLVRAGSYPPAAAAACSTARSSTTSRPRGR
jgi:hypothetical protein